MQQPVHGLGKRRAAQVGQFSRYFGANLLMYGVAFDEHGSHTQPSTKLDVGERVADHDTAIGSDLRKHHRSLFEQSRQRFAAVALSLVVRADVKTVHMCAMGPQNVLQRDMNGFDIGGGVESQGNAALVADHNYSHPGLIQPSDRFNHARKQVKLGPAGDITAFRHLFIQHAVAIKENGLHGVVERVAFGVCHSVMITIPCVRISFSQSAYPNSLPHFDTR